jgi:hypothetical protein
VGAGVGEGAPTRRPRRTVTEDLMNETQVARSLGLFGVGLGAAELIAPRLFTRALGTQPRTGLVRTAYGLREIAAGAGVLAQPNPAPWMWARVAGDALDLFTLGKAFKRTNVKRRNVGLALAAVAGLTALDLFVASRLTSNGYAYNRFNR